MAVVREEGELRQAFEDRSSCGSDRLTWKDVEGDPEADGRKIQYGRGGVMGFLCWLAGSVLGAICGVCIARFVLWLIDG